MKKNRIALFSVFLVFIIITISLFVSRRLSYGVFIGCTKEEQPASSLPLADILVVDLQYYSSEDVNFWHDNHEQVYSYLDIGSLETYRDYYNRFSQLALKPYDGFEDEYWVDITAKEWSDFIINELAVSLVAKGADGLFIDNLDVYYQYPSKEAFNSIVMILNSLKALSTNIIINGGDIFLKEYESEYHNLSSLISGINQEDALGPEKAYFTEYLDYIDSLDIPVYIIEYTQNPFHIIQTKFYCKSHEYNYYIAGNSSLSY